MANPDSPIDHDPLSATDDLNDEPRHVELRRRRGLSAAVALGGAVVTAAYLTRVVAGAQTWLDWTVLAVVVVITGVYLAVLSDSRAPLLIIDEQGVRVRRGATWRGIAWSEVPQIEHHPGRGLFGDGSLVIRSVDEDEIVMKLSLATRLHGVETRHLTEAISQMSGSDTAVLELRERQPLDEMDELDDLVALETLHGSVEIEPAPESLVVATELPEPEPVASEPVRASATPLPLRTLISGVRSEITRQRERGAVASPRTAATHGATHGATALHLSVQDTAIRLPEDEVLRRAEPEFTDLMPSAPPPISDQTPEEILQELPDPVIGPVLTAARERLGLSVDQVAGRTRIRTHVIEAIEIDDFAPCGGDFYARGHLRTLARVLGVDAGPLLAEHAERYAHAPIDPRRVFEADLAVGSSGSIRGTRGGPNWSVLIAAVMTVVLIWSVARLITGDPSAVEPEAPRLNPSGGLNPGAAAAPEVPVVLTASGGGARVIVRNGNKVVFNGQIAFGQSTTVQASPPVRISTTDGSLRVRVDGDDRGAMGETGQEAQATYVVR